MLYAIYGLRCGGRVADKARGKAECFIMQRDPHTSAGGRLTVLVLHFFDCVILLPLCHLQADWLTPFDFAAHSYSGREMKRTAAAVTRDEKTPPPDPPTKKAIVEPEEAQSLWRMCH